ncbi:MAG: hypothetical protein AAFR87_01530 [Bacteroidota bacterium]
MAPIIEHISTNKRYVLLGAGLDVYQSSPKLVIKETGVEKPICVSNPNGGIQRLQSQEFIVLRVDGKSLEELLHS